jgi:hypothetical protein
VSPPSHGKAVHELSGSVNSLRLTQLKHLVWHSVTLLIKYVQGLTIHHPIDVTFADETINRIALSFGIIPLCRSIRNFAEDDGHRTAVNNAYTCNRSASTECIEFRRTYGLPPLQCVGPSRVFHQEVRLSWS